MPGTPWTATSTGSRCRSSACRSRRRRHPQVSADVLGQLSGADYPHVVEVITHVMQSGRVEDFEFGLDLILDGLQRILDQGDTARTPQSSSE